MAARQRNPQGESRGATLFFVLLLTAVMATLMAAFVTINRNQIALSANTQSRESAYDACMSGLYYLQSRLELDQSWGSTSFPAGNSTIPYPAGFQVTVFGDGLPGPAIPSPASNYIIGKLNSPSGINAEFTARVVNNLQSSTSQLGTPLGDVPARAVRVRIDAQSRGIKRRLEAVMRRRAFTDAVLASGMDLLVGPTGVNWTASTRDVSNLVRANGSAFIPKPTGGDFRFTGRRGQVKAGGEIRLDTLWVSNATKPGLQTEENMAKGTFQVKSRPSVIPDLRADQMHLPATNIVIPPGNYSMTECIQEQSGGVPLPNGNYTVTQLLYRAMSTPGNVVAGKPQPSIVEKNAPGSGGWLGPAPTVMAGTNTPTIFSNSGKDVVVDLSTGDVYIPPGVTLSTVGNINFLGNNLYSGGKTTPVNTTLNFGTELTGNAKNPFASPFAAFSNQDAINQMEAVGGALVATNGSVLIGGTATGLGSISGDQNVKFSAQPGLYAKPSASVAVRAGGDLTLDPPPKTSTVQAFKCDGPIFNSAMNATKNWPSFDGWAVGVANNTLLKSLVNQTVTDPLGNPLKGAQVWDVLAKDTNKKAGAPDSTFSSQPYFSSPFTLETYVRAREYMKSGNANWLDTASTNNTFSQAAVVNAIDQQTGGYSNFARMASMKTQQLMANGGIVPEMFFVGLVYAGGSVTVHGGNHTFYTEGGVVAKGSITMSDVPDVTTVYNHDYLEDITKQVGSHTRLDVTYFNLQ